MNDIQRHRLEIAEEVRYFSPLNLASRFNLSAKAKNDALLLLFGIALIFLNAIEAYSAEIEWEVLNRFSLFENAKNVDQQERAIRSASIFNKYSYAAESQKNDSGEVGYKNPTRAAYESGRWKNGSPFGGPGLPIEDTWWDESKGRYRPGFYIPPEYVVLRIRPTSSSIGDCRWEVGNVSKIQSCSTPFEDVVINSKEIPVSVFAEGTRTVNMTISVRHRIIIGLGDSYASGEGNPDMPVTWEAVPKSEPSSSSLFVWPNKTMKNKSEWLSRRCHRSFWSWQLQTALWQASIDRHSIVTFGTYACSGAEIWDGMLARQSSPPGVRRGCEHIRIDGDKQDENNHCFLKHSQISALVQDLCTGDLLESSIKNTQLPKNPLYLNQGETHINTLPRHVCSNPIDPDRKIERILLSIGGNDVGFGGVIRWSLTPAKSHFHPFNGLWNIFGRSEVICPSDRALRQTNIFGDCVEPVSVARRKEHLEKNAFQALDAELRLAFKDFLPKISVIRYMNPLMEPDGKNYCATAERREKGARPNRQSAWDGVVTEIYETKKLAADRWGINVTLGEARIVNEDVVEAFKSLKYPENWNTIDSHLEKFVQHGWCATERKQKISDFHFPAWSKGWQKNRLKPTDWHAFEPRERWFRTASDSILTQYERDLGGGLNGVFHPTAQGHAEIADALIENW